MKKIEKEYSLDRGGIDAVSEELIKWMKQAGIRRENAIRLRLTMEEVMLRISDHFGGQITGNLQIRKRLGTPVLRLCYKGESFNPIETSDQEDEITQDILERIGLAPSWGYRAGVNELILRGPRENVRQEVWLILSVLLAFLAGALPGVLPEEAAAGLRDFLISPAADAFMNALGTFVGLMIFTSVVSGICSVGNVSDFSRMGGYVIRQTLFWSFFGTAAAGLCMLPFFSFGIGAVSGGTSQAGELIEMIYAIIPSNPVSPFADGNMLQIIFMAVLTGIGILVLGEKVGRLQEIFGQMNKLLLQIVGAVCKLLPVYIFASLTVLLWDNGYGVFIRLWQPLVIGAVCDALLLVIKLIYASVRLRAGAGMLFSKIRETVLTGLFTASSSAAFGQMIRINEKKLGISREFNRFALPLGNMIVISPSGAGFLVILYYLADYYQIPINTGWIITAIFLSVMFSITAPPVSGGMVICLGMLMTALGIPSAGLAVGGILCIILEFTCTSSRLGILHMELAMEARNLGMLNREILMKS